MSQKHAVEEFTEPSVETMSKSIILIGYIFLPTEPPKVKSLILCSLQSFSNTRYCK